jgi:hypothetical protein
LITVTFYYQKITTLKKIKKILLLKKNTSGKILLSLLSIYSLLLLLFEDLYSKIRRFQLRSLHTRNAFSEYNIFDEAVCRSFCEANANSNICSWRNEDVREAKAATLFTPKPVVVGNAKQG